MDIKLKNIVTATVLTIVTMVAPAAAQKMPSLSNLFEVGLSPSNVFDLMPTPDSIANTFRLDRFNGGHRCGGGCSQCNQCNQCQTDCCCTCWYVQAEVLFLDREMSDSVVSLFDSSALPPFTPGEEALSANDFSFSSEAGVRLTLGRELDLWNSLEFTYMGLHDWSTSAQTPADSNQDINLVLLSGFSRFTDAYQQFAWYSSNLNSFELNHRHYVKPSLSILAGIRYMNIDENFQVVSHDSPSPTWNQIGTYNADTNNHLLGAQIGASWERPVSDRLMFNLNGKAGLMLNFVSSNHDIYNPNSGGGILVVNRHREEEELASILELNAIANYSLTDNVSLMAGYNLIIVNGVALAVQQVPSGIDTGTILYHGPSIGFEYRR